MYLNIWTRHFPAFESIEKNVTSRSGSKDKKFTDMSESRDIKFTINISEGWVRMERHPGGIGTAGC